MDKQFILTEADNNAVSLGDSNYLINKGAALNNPDTYKESVDYYNLAAALGNSHAISNLGYCYLYGRGVEANLSLALAYFRIAAMKHDIDAMYKLGDIYSRDKWGIKDEELSVYYYRMAASYLIGKDWESNAAIAHCRALQEYPSLCFALGRELSVGSFMNTDLDYAYQFLKHAEKGYEIAISSGQNVYENPYISVTELLSDPQFDIVRDLYDRFFE